MNVPDTGCLSAKSKNVMSVKEFVHVVVQLSQLLQNRTLFVSDLTAKSYHILHHIKWQSYRISSKFEQSSE